MLFLGEQPVDEHGGQNDQSDNHEDYQHANTHIAQAADKACGIKIKVHTLRDVDKEYTFLKI